MGAALRERVEAARPRLGHLTPLQSRLLDRLAAANGAHVATPDLVAAMWDEAPAYPAQIVGVIARALALRLRATGLDIECDMWRGRRLVECAIAKVGDDDAPIVLDPPAPHAVPAIDGQWDDDDWVAA